jgi:nicotinate-nucleotide--dimethylbenzimidazole phosphoribosyltransferase
VRRELGGEVGDLLHTDAMDPALYAAALRAGADEVDAQGPALRVLVLGEMGIGNSTAAAAVYAALLGGDPAQYGGPGTGVQGEALARKRRLLRTAVERALHAHPGLQDDPHRALQTLGGRDIAAITGAMARAISRGVAVLVDGYIVGAAALALCRLDPGWRAGMIFAHRSAEPAHARALAAMQATPLLDLGMRLGEASGALVAFPLLEAACVLHAEMATFREAQVPDREDMSQ